MPEFSPDVTIACYCRARGLYNSSRKSQHIHLNSLGFLLFALRALIVRAEGSWFALRALGLRAEGSRLQHDTQKIPYPSASRIIVHKQPERLDATFLTSAPALRQAPPPDQPEVCFAGRSNAGKSSVLNQLTGSRHTAKVSKTPGRTQLLNFFDVRTGGRLVDLPGYGYAKAAKSAQKTWQAAVNDYLTRREALVGLILVMDIRHPSQTFDNDIITWCSESGLLVHVLLNKADKLSFSNQKKALMAFQQRYQSNNLVSAQCFSATKGIGREKLLELLLLWLAAEEAAPDPDLDFDQNSDSISEPDPN